MPSLAELARAHTAVGGAALGHLQRLVASWGLLADFCFADLLLFVPVQEGGRFVVLGQIRPTTSQTLYRHDMIGELSTAEERPLVARSFRLDEIIEGETTIPALRERVRVLCIPVRWEGQTVGVLSRESAPSVGRAPGELERTYVEVFNRFARMIAAGDFPYAAVDTESEEAPRVGDGVILLDGSARVAYTSPNAVSALHRIGVHANTEGVRLGEVGLEENVVRTAFTIAAPVTEEIERGPDVVVLVRCIPLVERGHVSGAVVLLRGISGLRHRDRLLISKDATIREIHHRVKNNLQTISSLLRLQGRRLASPEAKAAVEESVRRIRSIALVHETLSHEAGEDVPFTDILRPLVRMVEESLSTPEHPVRFSVQGDGGVLPAGVATPLAVVLTELLQNAVDHAFPTPGETGEVVVGLDNAGDRLTVCVADDGVGVPTDFSLSATTGLGLSIVRTLVTSELAGTIDMRSRDLDGTCPGTVVKIVVPLAGQRRDDETSVGPEAA